MQTLKFSTGNAKLGKRLIFSLPAGYSCPNAGHCKTFADRDTGKILDLPNSSNATGLEYRCFAAMSEARSKNCRDARWYNWNLIKENLYATRNPVSQITKLIVQSIYDQFGKRKSFDLCRIHESGDFWSELYFKAWLDAAKQFPNMKFYAYTKQINFWLNSLESIPDNFYLTASIGGNLDHLIPRYAHKLKRIAYVVHTEDQAAAMGLSVDHDDSHCFGDKPFALLVHGSQRAGSDASKALSLRKKQGEWSGYNKHNKAV